MKKIYFLTLILLVAVTGWSQTTKTWNGPATGGSWATNGNWSPTGTPGTNDIVVINGGVSGNITNVPTITLRGLRIEGNSTVNFTATAARTISVAGVGGATSFNVESGSSLTLAGGNAISIAFTRGTGTGNTLGSVAGNLTVANASAVTFNAVNTITTVNGTVEISGNNGSVSGTAARLNFAAGGTYIHGINDGAIPTATWAATSNCNVTGVTTTIDNTSFDQTFGNLTWNCTSQTAGFSLAANLSDIAGNFTVASTGTGDLRLKQTGGNTTTTVGGNFTLSGGTLYIVQSSGTQTLSVAGDVTISGGTLIRGGAGSTANFVFNGTSEQVYSKTGGTISGVINFSVNSGATVNFGTSLLDGTNATFTLSSGAKITTANAAGLASTGNTGSIRVGGTRTYDAGADYEFRGAATGAFTTTGSNVRNLTFSNASGEVSMGRSFNVTGVLALSNGYVTPGANTLLITTTGSASTSNGGFVNGQLSKQINSGTTFSFPVGKVSNGLRPIQIVTNSGNNTTTFVAEFLRASGSSITNGSVYGSGISRVSQCEYWTLNRPTGNRGGQVTISWDANSPCNGAQYVTELTSLRVARHDGTAWQNAGPVSGGANFGSTLGAGTITSSNVTSFSPFALATSNASENPLPVLFADVKAYAKNTGVQVEWSNLTEREIVNYEVERSANGIDFTAIDLQLPKSNRDDKASYTYFDAAPVTGSNYYRIRVQEQGGKVIYSKILRVEIGSTKQSFSLYPNPVVGKQLTVSLSGVKQGKYNLEVINAAGQRVFTSTLSNVSTGVTQMIELPATVKPGIYMTIISGDNYRETKQFIVQ